MQQGQEETRLIVWSTRSANRSQQIVGDLCLLDWPLADHSAAENKLITIAVMGGQ